MSTYFQRFLRKIRDIVSGKSAVLEQLVRYCIGGLGLAVVFSIVYESILHANSGAAQLANVVAFLASTSVGYFIHSRWSFRNHGPRDVPVRNTVRFLIVNLAGFALNSFWVWLIVQQLDLSVHLPLILILGVTPWLSFWANRLWTFG